jgi:hypothetical protein
MERLEHPVGGGGAPTGVGVVHDVVVYERGSVEDLERGRRKHDRGQLLARRIGVERVVARTAGDGLPPPVAKESPEPLASGEIAPGEVDDLGEFGCHVHEVLAAFPKELIDSQLDEVY